MANSLRNKIKHFYYKGELSESESNRLLNALDDADRINSELNRVKTELEQQPCEDCISKEKMIKVIEQMEKLEEDLYRTEGAESSFATLCLCIEWIKEALE